MVLEIATIFGRNPADPARSSEVAALPKDDLLEEIGIPLTPVRLKCAILGLGVLKVALHRSKGTPLPEEWSTLADELEFDGDD